jgi:intein/homing endonuclease
MKIESPDMVTNYNGGFPEITSNVKPQLIQFGPILAIEGRGVEVLEGSAFIKAHPGVEYIVNVYEDIDSVKARFKAMYGYNITEYDWYTKEHEVSEELQKDSKSPTGRLIAGSDDILSEAIVRKVSDVAIQIEKDILAYSPRNNKCLMLVGHCLSGDTKLRLLDGTSKTIRELSSVYEPDQEFWVYSCKEDGEVVPAPAMFSRVTKTVDKMAHVTLDNGEVIKCTVDHPFMMRDGSYVPADRLVSGDSLMPLYYRKTGEESSYLQAYPRIIDNKSGDEVLVHRLVVSSVLGGYKNPLTICHHKDFNQSNNDPSNLILMTKEDHDNLHKSGWREVRSQNGKDTSYRIHHSEEFKSTRKLLSELASIHISEFNKTSWKNPEYRQKISSQTSQLHKDGLLVLSKESLSLRNSRRNKTLWGNPEYRQKMSDMLASRSYNWIKPQTELSIISTRRNKVLKIVKSMLDSGTKLSESVYESLRPKCGTLSYSKAINYFGSEQELLRQASVFNHKVVSVVIVDSLNTPVYDITVPDYHNFALASGVFVHNSGIAKSAIIKSVVDKLDNAAKKPTAGALAGKEIDIKTDEVINDHPRWGYRIIDIRSAFLDKADFLGYVHLEELDGKQVWTDSPKSELLAASTAFVKETRKFIMGTPRTALNGPTLDRLYELAKTPVIFFDEINRAPISIMSQIMVIINQHRLNDYNVDIAVKIAAINSLSTPRGGPNDKQAAIVYHTTDVFDKAIRDRFIAIEMSASDQSIIDGTYNWLKDTFKASYLATSILNTAYSKKMLYKIEMVDDNGKFPTFRGWEHICQYAVWCEKQKIKPMQMIIDSLVGKDAGKQLGLKDVDYSAATEQFIEHTTAAGVPMLLLGKMGIGKTAKMNAVASKTNIEMIRVDLSAQDRTTVSGYPKVEGLCDYMVDKGLQDESFKAWSAALLKNPKVPIQTTAFIPNKQLAEKISICRRMGKKLVIMFDEVNRPFTLDTKVKLMDGTILTMQEIIDKYGTNEYFWIYSSDADGNIHPAKARSLGITRKQDKVVKVSLDNGSNEKCSLDHPWMLRNGTYVEAQYLKPGDSLMPLYYQFDEAGYEMVKNNYTGVWEYTHRLSDEYNILTGLYPRVGTVRHHKNFNKKNNSPDNIQRMTWSQHRSIHHAHLETTLGKHHSRMQKDPAYLADLLSKTLQNPDYMQKAHVNSAKTRSSSQQYKEKKSIHMLSQHKNGVFSHDLSKASKKTVLNRTISIVKKLIEQGITLTEENYTEYKNKYRGTSGRGGNVALSLSKIKEQFGSFNDFIHLATCNHKVVSVEVLDKLEDVSCLTVEGYNNFALASGVIVHNCTPVVQSAVFEAISDHRLFGNDLTGIEYSVVAAGNKGEGYQVAEMDTATLHRFATLTINTLTAEDLNE